MRKIVWFSLSLLILAGCATMTSQVTSKLSLGMTKQAVLAKCGQPYQAGAIKDKDGKTLESFTYKEYPQPFFSSPRAWAPIITYVYFADGKVIYYGGNPNIPTEQSQTSQK